MSEHSEEEISGVPEEESADEALSGAELPPRIPKAQTAGTSRRWPWIAVAGCLVTCCLCCVVPWCVLLATGVGVAAVLSNSESTVTQTERFDVDPDSVLTLTVDGTAGEINVQRGTSGDEVSVTYTKKAFGWTKNAAQKELDNITVGIQQPAEDTISVTVETDRTENGLFFLANQVDMTITVPEDVRLDLDNNTGSIQISGVTVHSLNAHSNTGSITLDAVLVSEAGATYNVETNTGSITVILPVDVYARLEAHADVGSVSVANDFDHVDEDSRSRPSGAGEEWTGTLGTGEDEPLALSLRTNTGSVDVRPR